MENMATTTTAEGTTTEPQYVVEPLSTIDSVCGGFRGIGGRGGRCGRRRRGGIYRTIKRMRRGDRRNIEKYLIDAMDGWDVRNNVDRDHILISESHFAADILHEGVR